MTYSDWLPDSIIDAALAARNIDPADVDTPAVPEPPRATCANPACALPFEPAYPAQRFCSQPCGRVAGRQRGRRKDVVLRPCLQCAQPIPREAKHTPHKYAKIKYCPTCRTTGYGLSARTRSRRVLDASRRTVMMRRDGVAL